jgi:hypothetical protein
MVCSLLLGIDASGSAFDISRTTIATIVYAENYASMDMNLRDKAARIAASKNGSFLDLILTGKPIGKMGCTKHVGKRTTCGHWTG